MTEALSARGISPPAWLPAVLSFVAGYVDIYTFLALFGLFVANVTGSFVTAGAEIVTHDTGIIAKAIAVLAFLSATALAAGLIEFIRERRGTPLPWMLVVEAALLAVFTALVCGGPNKGVSDWHRILAGLFAAMAMGTQSVIVRLLMVGIPQTNVMTGNMTQLGIEATSLLLAWQRQAREHDTKSQKEFIATRSRLLNVLAIAIGFLLGAIAGAVSYASAGVSGASLAVVVVAGLAVWALLRCGQVA
jgi:uncharacterized membrane protein YoaK (UPF0700 family)